MVDTGDTTQTQGRTAASYVWGRSAVVAILLGAAVGGQGILEGCEPAVTLGVDAGLGEAPRFHQQPRHKICDGCLRLGHACRLSGPSGPWANTLFPLPMRENAGRQGETAKKPCSRDDDGEKPEPEAIRGPRGPTQNVGV